MFDVFYEKINAIYIVIVYIYMYININLVSPDAVKTHFELKRTSNVIEMDFKRTSV